jgi:hypothetical protein
VARSSRLGLALLLALLLARPSAAQAACKPVDLAATAWPAATEVNAAGKPWRRFIPPELYGGAPWNGDRAIVLRPMNVTRKPAFPADHPAISIIYPMPLPDASEIQVMQRIRHGRRSGVVEQYFAVNEHGDGLGRIADFRPGRQRSEMAECFKFPLGLWEQGETRVCRESTIVILEIDFVHDCVPHALKFRWNDEGSYIFAPDRGMVAVTH